MKFILAMFGMLLHLILALVVMSIIIGILMLGYALGMIAANYTIAGALAIMVCFASLAFWLIDGKLNWLFKPSLKLIS